MVILSVSSNVDFGYTREVLLIGTYHMCYEDRNECVLEIQLMCPENLN